MSNISIGDAVQVTGYPRREWVVMTNIYLALVESFGYEPHVVLKAPYGGGCHQIPLHRVFKEER
jgi:hypothetical protein